MSSKTGWQHAATYSVVWVRRKDQHLLAVAELVNSTSRASLALV